MKAERHPSAHEMCSAQPLCTAAERRFVEAMNAAADDGVGFGWMQQVAEWEWLHRHGPGAWGPFDFQRRSEMLEGDLEALEKRRNR